jgi:hypothetical protein
MRRPARDHSRQAQFVIKHETAFDRPITKLRAFKSEEGFYFDNRYRHAITPKSFGSLSLDNVKAILASDDDDETIELQIMPQMRVGDLAVLLRELRSITVGKPKTVLLLIQ